MSTTTNNAVDDTTVTLRRTQRQATLTLYQETIRKIDEAKKKKKSRAISITLTPDESSRETVLLSSTSQLSPLSTPLAPRRVSISFSSDVQIFEVPKLEYIDHDCSEIQESIDVPNIVLAKSQSTDTYSEPATAVKKVFNEPDRKRESLGAELDGQFENLTGFSPRPTPKFHSQESENNETNLKNPVSYNSPSNNPAIVSNKDTSFHENQIRKRIVPSLKIHGANGTEIEHSPGNSSNKKEIKGILKPGGPCARVILSSDNSGMEFNSRCLRLYKNEEQHIGRFSKFGGERPDGQNGIFDCRVMSREHASMFYQDGRFFIRDLNSSNGTYLVIDGKPAMCINKETNDSMIEVFSGDILQFGQDIPEIIRRNSYSNPREKIKEKQITKCIRAKLTLFHPSNEECKARYCGDSKDGQVDAIKENNLLRLDTDQLRHWRQGMNL